MDEFEFDRLLDLYQKGLLSGKEKEMLENWLHQVDSGHATPLSEVELGRVKRNIEKKIKQPALGQWTIMKMAASVLIVLAIGVLAYYITSNSNNRSTDFKTIAGNGLVSKVTLPDGTLVWLKGNSSIEAPSAFSGNTRNVILHGEALFEVTKDASHPFIIESGKVITTVLGTSFNLKSGSDEVELTVLTGKVSLRSCDNDSGIIVLPNERVVYNSQKLLVSRENIAAEEKTTAVDGTDYSMLFNDAALGEIFERIETKFDVKITLSNEALRDCVIRADFSDQSLNETMEMICQALDFEFSVKGKVVHLKGEPCR